MDLTAIRRLLTAVRQEGRLALTEPEALAVLDLAGIRVTRAGVAGTVTEAVALARELGFPVVMKIVSPDILHKSEAGGVRVGVTSEREVRAAYRALVARARAVRPTAAIRGILVQAQVAAGVEAIVGSTTDPQFGPVVMFGAGGLLVELLGDVTFRVAPLTRDDAADMLAEIRATKLLDGFRGQPPVDRAALVDAIVRLGTLAYELRDEIREVEVNPLILARDGVTAVDALLTLHPVAVA
ncbi:MAG: acetate--CoA ligase family protein [Deltaproteobacteria bacterium]|nr:acetate--CoA ligase family protein [Deltaproteobacteria bacterium]